MSFLDSCLFCRREMYQTSIWPVAIEWTSIRYCSIFLMLHISCEKDKHVPSTSHCLGRSSGWFKILKLQKSARKENMMPIWSSMYTYERSSMWCHSSEAPHSFTNAGISLKNDIKKGTDWKLLTELFLETTSIHHFLALQPFDTEANNFF